MGLFAREAPEQEFWKWFSKNESQIYASDGYSPIIKQLSEKLSEYKSGITYEISNEESNKKGLIISADGIREFFPDVIALYKAAPKLDKWEIIAFRPRMEKFANVKLEYKGKEFDPKKIWIHPIREDGNFDLIIYYPGLTEESKNLVISGVYILLDTALGEYDVVTGIRYLDFHKLPDNPESEGLLPFTKLREIFDKNKKENG